MRATRASRPGRLRQDTTLKALAALGLMVLAMVMVMRVGAPTVATHPQRLLRGNALGCEDVLLLAPSLLQAHDAMESMVERLEGLVGHGQSQELPQALTTPDPMNATYDDMLLHYSLKGISDGDSPLAPLFRQRLARRPCPSSSATAGLVAGRRDVAICAVFRNEARVLDEWIAFHYLQGEG